MFPDTIQQMLDRYEPVSVQDYENALKEIIQEVALLGLWRSKFYEKAVFYGGSALRILHGLDRFSEDLDFSLIEPDHAFDIARHLNAVRMELESQGFETEIKKIVKARETPIDSAFIKANTLMHLLKINVDLKTHKNSVLKIKLEVDRDPATGFASTAAYHLSPVPFSVRTMTLPSLFAGKMHALLCRTERAHVKGRDWYDLVWFVKKETPCNIEYLRNKMIQTGHIKEDELLTRESLIDRLEQRIVKTDFIQARRDIEPFLRNTAQKESLDLWTRIFFNEFLAGRIKTVDTEA